jgi:chaperonin cofactor prefoldin|tara:strand:- start:2 stop:157 length:156 start_codon:yes stop_codon:yes gene_type:complete
MKNQKIDNSFQSVMLQIKKIEEQLMLLKKELNSVGILCDNMNNESKVSDSE